MRQLRRLKIPSGQIAANLHALTTAASILAWLVTHQQSALDFNDAEVPNLEDAENAVTHLVRLANVLISGESPEKWDRLENPKVVGSITE